jgi:hypothetical protein
MVRFEIARSVRVEFVALRSSGMTFSSGQSTQKIGRSALLLPQVLVYAVSCIHQVLSNLLILSTLAKCAEYKQVVRTDLVACEYRVVGKIRQRTGRDSKMRSTVEAQRICGRRCVARRIRWVVLNCRRFSVGRSRRIHEAVRSCI